MWKVPTRWPRGGSRVGNRVAGLEFCATILTNSSICAFSCALLCPPSSDDGDGQGGRGLKARYHEELGGSDKEILQRRRRMRQPRVAKNRLYCVVGSDNGFVQAWEASLVGEAGVGGQPLWSQKVCSEASACSRHVPVLVDFGGYRVR